MTSIILVVIIAIIAFILAAVIKTRNDFVALRNRVKNQGAQIDAQLKRRFDLIPNLIQTVKGQANFEKTTLEAVMTARANAMQGKNLAESVAANDALTGALGRLLAVAESYPELKANGGFLNLQKELSDTESKIAYARQFYNDTVLKYNNAIQMFPANLIAGMFNFAEQAFLEASTTERASISINATDFAV